MSENINNVFSMILDLAGLASGEDYIGTHKVDKSLSTQSLLDNLHNETGQKFGVNAKDWALWYKSNHELDEQKKLCLQFAIVSGQVEKIKDQKKKRE